MAVNEEKMLKLMKGAADIGGELFVMDDGWFASKKFNRDPIMQASATGTSTPASCPED